MSPPPDTAAPAGAAAHASRAIHAARILAMADALEQRAPRSRPEVRTVLAATSRDLVFVRLAPRVVIGRARGCGLVLDDPRVSRRHAALFVHHGELWIEDLESTNGTTVDGEPIRRHSLAPGEEVRLGGEPVRFWLR